MANFVFTAGVDSLSGTNAADDYVASAFGLISSDDSVRAQQRDGYSSTSRDILNIVATTANQAIALTGSGFPGLSGIEVIGPSGSVAYSVSVDDAFVAANRGRDGRIAIWPSGSGTITVSGSALTDPTFGLYIGNSPGNNKIDGSVGNDVILVDTGGADSINAGGGNDLVYVTEDALNQGFDTLLGGSGIDTLEIADPTGGWSLTTGTGILSNVSGFERFGFGLRASFDTDVVPVTKVGFFRDLTVTNAFVNTLPGNTLEIDIGRFNASITTGVSAAGLTGVNAIRVIQNTSPGACILSGGAAGDTLLGGFANDVLNGDSGHNILDGGGGNDTITAGGAGTSTVRGGSGADLFQMAASGGGMVIQDPAVGDHFSLPTLGSITSFSVGAGASMAANSAQLGAPSNGVTPLYLRGAGAGMFAFRIDLPGTWMTENFQLTAGNLVILSSPFQLPSGLATLTGSAATEGFTITPAALGAGDVIEGGGGGDWIQLDGSGAYDFSAASAISGIPVVRGLTSGNGTVTLGGAWSGTYSDGLGNEAISLAANFSGTVFVGTGSDTLSLGAASGVTAVSTGGGTTAITLGSGTGTVFAGAIQDGGTTISGGSGTYTIVGGADPSALTLSLSGSTGSYLVFRRSNGAEATTGSGNDTIVGDEGDQVFTGGAGNDVLFGLAGFDSLSGGSGNDVLLGGDGDDTLAPGSGANTVFGGAGADRFVIDLAGSGDRVAIADFSSTAGDRLAVSGLGLTSITDVQSKTTVEVVPGGVRYTITAGAATGAVIDLVGLSAPLTSTDFAFS